MAQILHLIILAVLLLALVSRAMNLGGVQGQKLSEREFEELLEKMKKAAGDKFTMPADPIDEEEGHRARDRLFAEQERLKESEKKAAEALAKWNQLSDAEKKRVVELAQERAAKHREEIVRDMDMSTKLLKQEAAMLEKQLDERLAKEKEEELQADREVIEKDRLQYEEERERHRNRQLEIRTTSKALSFWMCLFMFSTLLTGFAYSRK